ncbi:MAG: hypothetical protein WD157_00260 [Patescibacteria group bacterium]
MGTILLILALCTSQPAGATTQQSLEELFRSQLSVADRTKVLLDWSHKFGDSGIEPLVATDSISVISNDDRLKVIKRFIGDFKLRRELLEKAGVYATARSGDKIASSDFDTVKKIVEKDGYDKWVKEYVSYLDTGLFARYVAIDDDKRPHKVVSVTFGGHEPGYLIRLYFFYRLTKEDWALDFILPQIEVPA